MGFSSALVRDIARGAPRRQDVDLPFFRPSADHWPGMSIIEIAREAEFALGPARVRPALRVLEANGAQHPMEPRVMQALVALARRPGEVMARDALAAAMWGDRAVGEDGIQRAIAKLRRVGEASGAFAIVTAPKVGYRLEPVRAAAMWDESGMPTLAVLAFDNLSGDPALDVFCDGVSDQVLQTIAQGTSIRVIGRASSFQLRGPAKATANVVAQLGVTHLLDGSVRRAAGRVRIGVQLVEATTQTAIWSTDFDRPDDDLPAIQDEIGSGVALTLHHKFSRVRRQGLDPVRHERLVRAFHAMLNEPTNLSHVQAIDDLAALAPESAVGWHYRSEARNSLRFNPSIGEAEAARLFEEQRICAERAYALDPIHAAPQIGNLLAPCGDFTERERLYRITAAGGWTPPALTGLLLRVGRSSEALEAALQSRAREPLIFPVRLAHQNALAQLGRLDEWAEVAETDLRRYPATFRQWAVFVRAAALYRRWALVDRWLTPERMASYPADEFLVKSALRVAGLCRDPGQGERARLVAELEAEIAIAGMARPFTLCLAGALGDPDLAYDFVKRSSFAPLLKPGGRSGGDLSDTLVLFLPHAEPLRRDPRFVALCARLGMVRHWCETGRWPDYALQAPYDFRAEAARADDLPLG